MQMLCAGTQLAIFEGRGIIQEMGTLNLLKKMRPFEYCFSDSEVKFPTIGGSGIDWPVQPFGQIPEGPVVSSGKNVKF